MTQPRKHYAANRKRMRQLRILANMRAAKARLRIERANAEPIMPDISNCPPEKPAKPSGFEVRVKCLDDGQAVTFRSVRLPWGLSVSPTLAGRKVAAILANYGPPKIHAAQSR